LVGPSRGCCGGHGKESPNDEGSMLQNEDGNSGRQHVTNECNKTHQDLANVMCRTQGSQRESMDRQRDLPCHQRGRKLPRRCSASPSNVVAMCSQSAQSSSSALKMMCWHQIG
jgi:hypothetical protein